MVKFQFEMGILNELFKIPKFTMLMSEKISI